MVSAGRERDRMFAIQRGCYPIKIWLEKEQDLEESCLEQALHLAQLPFLHKWVCLMPDTHTGMGMPIGGVIAAKGAVITPLAQDAIRDIFRENPGAHPTPDLILQEVASFYSIPAERIRGNAKTRDVVGPRQAAIYLIREMTGMSLPEIGKFMGRDHTTALYAINKIEERLKNEPELQNEIADMKKNIQNR